MLSFVTGLFSNIYIKIIFGLVAISVIGGSILEIRYLQEKNQITQANLEKVEQINNDLQKRIKDLKFQNDQIVAEINRAKTADEAATARLAQLTEKYNSTKKRDQISNAREKKPQTILDLINKNTECNREHFSEQGKCINGNWQSQK